MDTPKTFADLYEQFGLRKIEFFLAFFVIMVITYGFLFVVDFIPEPISEDSAAITAPAPSVLDRVGTGINGLINGGLIPQAAEPVEIEPAGGMRVIIPEDPKPETTSAVEVEEKVSNVDPFPVSITLDPLGRTVPVLNPTSRDISALDAALLSGAVRHPDSADFSQDGNVFILAHSSYLPNVFNENFQAFNGIQELTWGDTIRVATTDTEYVYQVDRVYPAKASEVQVPVTFGKPKLTLATCNSFGSQEDRFIVEASLIDTYTI